MIRIGEGSDVHPLSFGKPLVLGGVTIPDAKGAKGHSDADCLTHAVIDAILGASGMGDIGHHFPDDDDRYKNASSIKLLETVCEKITKLGFTVHNIDATVMLQAPKIEPYKRAMAQKIAEALKIQPFQVNIKAKTGEGLGPVGKLEAIEAHAVCLVEEPDPNAPPKKKEQAPKVISMNIGPEEPNAAPEAPKA